MEHQQIWSSTAKIVIHLSSEMIFPHLSDPRQNLFVSGEAEGQGEEVKRTYRFFGIPITLKGQSFRVEETYQLTSGSIGLGTVFEQVGTMHGRIHKSEIKITEYEPPKVIEFIHSPAHMRSCILLTPADGNTLLTITITLNGGCHPFIGFIWASVIKQDLQKGLKRLKVTLESSEG